MKKHVNEANDSAKVVGANSVKFSKQSRKRGQLF